MQWLSLITIIVAASTLAKTGKNSGTYFIKKINGKIFLTGKGDDPQWQQANALTDFHYPWEHEPAPPTTFKGLHDEDWVYFLFVIKDNDVNIRRVTDHKTEVAASSRAEIFLRIDDKLSPYYCLELDPLGRVLDYQATYHRNFDMNWSWPKDHLLIRTEQQADGYSIELALSKKSLKELGLLQGHALQAGLFRANCKFKSNNEEEFKWISWMTPDAETPDFHIPSSFGMLHLENK